MTGERNEKKKIMWKIAKHEKFLRHTIELSIIAASLCVYDARFFHTAYFYYILWKKREKLFTQISMATELNVISSQKLSN